MASIVVRIVSLRGGFDTTPAKRSEPHQPSQSMPRLLLAFCTVKHDMCFIQYDHMRIKLPRLRSSSERSRSTRLQCRRQCGVSHMPDNHASLRRNSHAYFRPKRLGKHPQPKEMMVCFAAAPRKSTFWWRAGRAKAETHGATHYRFRSGSSATLASCMERNSKEGWAGYWNFTVLLWWPDHHHLLQYLIPSQD